MWFITNSSSDRIIFIKNNRTSIGRKGTDVELSGDDSLSRVHAYFILANDELSIQDAKSKYGTFLNNPGLTEEKLDDQPKILKDGDYVRFGVLHNNWITHHLEPKTCISMIDPQKKEKLVKMLQSLGVQVTDILDKTCTHLTMPLKTNVSNKLLQALTLCVPIVSPSFWIAFQDSFANDKPLPKCIDFAPKIKEENFITPGVITLVMNGNRKKLFAGKTFIFISSTQMKLFQDIIQNAGGKVTSLSQTKMTPKDLCAKNTIVIKAKESESQLQNQSAIDKINSALTSMNRRMVQETEIGYAVLHCSIDIFCNPGSSATSLIGTSNAALLKVTTSKELAPNTDSINLQAPTTSHGRSRSKKPVIATVVETIDLDSDGEVKSINKENIPSTIEAHASSSSVSTKNQATNHEIASLPETQLEEVCIPVTQDSSNLISKNKQDASDNSAGNKRLTRSSIRASIQNQEISSTPESSLFNFTIDPSSNSSSNNSRTQRKRKNSESADVPFISKVNLSNNSRPQRKRKISENVDTPVPSNSKAKKQETKPAKEPATKRNKIHRIIDQDSDEESQAGSSRKRSAETALGTDGGLFAFNTNFVKKIRSTPNDTQEESRTITGVVLMEKPKEPHVKPLTTFRDDSDDSYDSGVWLSKKMISINLSDSVDGIKTEVTEPNLSVKTEDIKPSQYLTTFNVLETTTGFNSTTSIVSKRKQFVKKKNYKSQSSIVTMKTLKVEQTYEQLEIF